MPRDVPVGWREQVADLEALREHWGLERLTIAGYSWGGLLALLYALEHPGRVERLALVSPAPAWREAREQFERGSDSATSTRTFQEARRVLRESGLRERDPDAYPEADLRAVGRPLLPRSRPGPRPHAVPGHRPDPAGSLGQPRRLRPPGRASGAARVPRWCSTARDDPIPIEAARTTAELIGAEFHPVPRCGHVPYVEHSRSLRESVGGFLPV